jgi:hypothetical protein
VRTWNLNLINVLSKFLSPLFHWICKCASRSWKWFILLSTIKYYTKDRWKQIEKSEMCRKIKHNTVQKLYT